MNKKAWLVCVDQQKLGPFLTETVIGLLKVKRLLPSELAWTEGEGDWRPLSEFPEFAPTGPFTRPVTRRVGGGPDPTSTHPGGPQKGPEAAHEEDAVKAYHQSVRKHRRGPIQGQIFTSDQKTFDVVNISEGGMLLRSQELPEVGKALEFVLRATALGEPLKISASVTRQTDTPGFRGFGLEFTQISNADQARIQNYIENLA